VEVGVDDDGDPITSCVVVPVENLPPDAVRKPTKSGHIFNEAFLEALDAKGQTIRVRGDGPSVKAVNVEDIRPEFYARYVTAEAEPKKRAAAQQKAFKRALSTSGLPTWANGAVEWIWQPRGP
jgi:hypothetical protein